MASTNTASKKSRKEWKKRVPRFDIDVNETYQIFQTYAPQIWEELMGLQSILKMPTRQIILNFGHYRFTDLKRKWLHGLSRQRLHG